MAAKHIISKSMRKKSALSKKPGTKFNWAAGRYERQRTSHDHPIKKKCRQIGLQDLGLPRAAILSVQTDYRLLFVGTPTVRPSG